MLHKSITVGWVVYRAHPQKMVGPLASFEKAVIVAERLGADFRMGYGERLPGADTFTPMEEPTD